MRIMSAREIVKGANNFRVDYMWLIHLALCIPAEKTRSFAATERSFTVKMFTFQFFTLFSSLIYVAFFLGR